MRPLTPGTHARLLADAVPVRRPGAAAHYADAEDTGLQARAGMEPVLQAGPPVQMDSATRHSVTMAADAAAMSEASKDMRPAATAAAPLAEDSVWRKEDARVERAEDGRVAELQLENQVAPVRGLKGPGSLGPAQ